MTVDTIPSWIWELDVTNGPGSATETWDDITAFVRGASINRGRQSETGRDQPGYSELMLDNGDRRFDWYYAGLIQNLIPNPSLEVNAAGYAATIATILRDAPSAAVGGFGLRVTTTNAASSGVIAGDATLLPVTPGLPYSASLSACLAVAGSKAWSANINWYNSSDGFIANSAAGFTLSSTVYGPRFSVSAVAPALSHHARIFVICASATGIYDVFMDAFQFEQAATPTAYNDGDQSNGRWEGTAHASRSFFGGPYYGGLKPMRRVRCRAAYNAVTYSGFYGYLDDPVQSYQGFADAVLQVSATDGLKVLAKKLVSGSFPAQRSDLRVAAILDAAGWPAGKRSLAVGVSFLDAITLDKVSALDHIQQVAESESGRFFMDASGNAKFVDRHTPYLTTSQATFGENEINYVDVTFAGGEQLIFNEILAQRAATGGEQRSATDATSQLDYFPSTLSHTGMLYDHDNESSDKTAFELSLYKDFHPRIVAMILDGTYQPLLVWPQALGRELGDRLTVRKRPPGGGAMIEQESFLEGIEHTVGVGTWDTVMRLTAVGIGYQIVPNGKALFELGHATNGKVGSSQVGVLAY